MKKVNARITSLKELIKRLMEGEVFYEIGGESIFYNASYKSSPFRYSKLSPSSQSLASAFHRYAEFLVESQWYEDIPSTGTICWVGETLEEVLAHEKLDIITSSIYQGEYNESLGEYTPTYFSRSRLAYGYKFATPVTKGEVL